MRAFYNTFKNIDEFVNHILTGLYDRDIYSYMYELAMEDDFDAAEPGSPTSLFEFIIDFSDVKERLYITPWDIKECKKRDMELCNKERKIILLLISVIIDVYSSLPLFIKTKYKRGENYEQYIFSGQDHKGS